MQIPGWRHGCVFCLAPTPIGLGGWVVIRYWGGRRHPCCCVKAASELLSWGLAINIYLLNYYLFIIFISVDLLYSPIWYIFLNTCLDYIGHLHWRLGLNIITDCYYDRRFSIYLLFHYLLLMPLLQLYYERDLFKLGAGHFPTDMFLRARVTSFELYVDTAITLKERKLSISLGCADLQLWSP